MMPLPWIELDGAYWLHKEARKAATDFVNNLQVRIVSIPEKGKRVKALVTVRQ